MKQSLFVIILIQAIIAVGCEKKVVEKKYQWTALEVTASAYNSVAWQTDGQPDLAAWGDTLRPDMKVIAVSRDLLKMGLKHNTMVKVDTLADTFYVKDKMHRKWRKRIDIYMGEDVKKAREWGKKKIMICYATPLDSARNSSK